MNFMFPMSVFTYVLDYYNVKCIVHHNAQSNKFENPVTENIV